MARLLALLLLSSALVLAAPPASAAYSEPCTGDPSVVAACGCPQGFWGITLVVEGETQSYVCFF